MSSDSLILKVEDLTKVYRFSEVQYTPRLMDNFLSKVNGAKPVQMKEVVALDHISFELEKGESLGIVGANGAGKSTILKVLSGVTKPTEGEVTIYGRSLSILDVGTGFHPDITGKENVYLIGEIYGLSRKEIDEKYKVICDFSEIGGFINKPVKYYSSGMFLRLAFSVVINMDADLLIFDEVLSVGDAKFRKKCNNKLDELRSNKTSIVLVSHSMNDIEGMCDKAIVLNHGKIERYGKTMEVLTYYYKSNSQSSAEIDLSSNVQSTESDATAKEEDSKPQAVEPYELLEVKTLTDTGDEKVHFEKSEEIVLSIKYKQTQPDKKVDVSYVLLDIFGSWLLRDGTFRDEQQQRNAGTYEMKVRIPPNFLNHGTFAITVIVHVNEKFYDRFEDRHQFEVEGYVSYIGGKLYYAPILLGDGPEITRVD